MRLIWVFAWETLEDLASYPHRKPSHPVSNIPPAYVAKRRKEKGKGQGVMQGGREEGKQEGHVCGLEVNI